MAGQFEKLIGIMKQSMYKAIGNGQLRWYELEEVILDVEETLNNRPLGFFIRRYLNAGFDPQPLYCLDSQIKFLKKNQPALKIKISENAPNTYGNVRTSYGKDGQSRT